MKSLEASVVIIFYELHFMNNHIVHCENKIDEICRVLQNAPITHTGLLTGVAGHVLFFSYAERCIEGASKGNSNKDVFIERIFNEINNETLLSYCSGFAGIGWLFEYLKCCDFIDIDTNVLLEDFDAVLKIVLEHEFKKKHYDFLHGALGVLCYFLKRAQKNKEMIPIINKSISQLEALSNANNDGSFKWRSIIDYKTGAGGYNISLSHGMASIAMIFVKIYQMEGVNREQITILLSKTIRYILNQEIDKDEYGCFFPNFALESQGQIMKSRLAWCYGDLGIATTLWQVGNTLDVQEWKNKAIEVLMYAAKRRRNLIDNCVFDAGLCHGTAGVGHIFYRMWRNTGLPEFKDTADYWFQETLKMAKFEDGLAGYKVYRQPQYGGYQNEYGLLEGIAGIGLALMTYYYDLDPTWDECLLLS